MTNYTIAEKNEFNRNKVHTAFVEFINKEIDNPENIFTGKIDGDTFARFTPINGFSNKAYNEINHALLFCYAAHCKDPRFATFNQIKENGYTLKKGCHGNLAAMNFPVIKDKETGKLRAVKKDGSEKPDFFQCRAFYVFNFADIENMSAFDLKSAYCYEIKHDQIEKMIAVYAEKTGLKIRHKNVNAAKVLGHYTPINHVIETLPQNAFKSAEDYYGVMLHELAHSTGDILGRKFGRTHNDANYKREELVAELSSFMLAMRFNVTYDATQRGNVFAYLKNYSGKNAAKRLENIEYAVTEAEKVVKYLTSFINENDEVENVENKITENKKETKKDILIDGHQGDLFGDFDPNDTKKEVAAAASVSTKKKTTKKEIAEFIAGLSAAQIKALKAMLG